MAYAYDAELQARKDVVRNKIQNAEGDAGMSAAFFIILNLAYFGTPLLLAFSKALQGEEFLPFPSVVLIIDAAGLWIIVGLLTLICSLRLSSLRIELEEMH